MLWVGARPTAPPLVTFAQMQAQLRITTTDETQYITDLVDACTEHAENALDSSLLQRTIVATYYGAEPVNLWTDYWDKCKLYLPRGPVQSITSVIDSNNTTITDWQLQRHGLADFCLVKGVFVAPLTITYVAGYGNTAAAVPSDLCMAIRMHVASLYRFREPVSDKALSTVPRSLEAFYALRRRTPPVG